MEFFNDGGGFFSVHEEKEFQKYLEYIKNKNNGALKYTKEYYIGFSAYREALLCWYPYVSNAAVFEIGGDIGALTGVLLQKASKVICYEANDRKRQIIRERYRGNNRLKLIGGSLEAAIEAEENVDYVVIHDLFGEVKKYIGADGYMKLLMSLKDKIREQGAVLICTPNRLGIKYLEGEAEEYSQKAYVGIHKFNGYQYIRTFSKNELLDLCSQCGYESINFYYPYPSMLFPVEIYTDEIMKSFKYGMNNSIIEDKIYPGRNKKGFINVFQKEDMGYFANCFILELKKKKDNPKILYYKSNYGCGSDEINSSITITEEKNQWKVQYSTENIRKENIVIDENGCYYFSENSIFINSGKRLNDILEEMLDRSLDETKDSGDTIQKIYALFGRLKEYLEKIDGSIMEWQGYYICMDTIYVLPDNRCIMLLWADEQVNDTLGYGLWKMVYDWYVDKILSSDLYHGLIRMKDIYLYLGIPNEDIYRYKAIRNKTIHEKYPVVIEGEQDKRCKKERQLIDLLISEIENEIEQ